MNTQFLPGQEVWRAGYRGVVLAEYLPGMYEVRLDRGDVVVPAEELKTWSEAVLYPSLHA